MHAGTIHRARVASSGRGLPYRITQRKPPDALQAINSNLCDIRGAAGGDWSRLLLNSTPGRENGQSRERQTCRCTLRCRFRKAGTLAWSVARDCAGVIHSIMHRVMPRFRHGDTHSQASYRLLVRDQSSKAGTRRWDERRFSVIFLEFIAFLHASPVCSDIYCRHARPRRAHLCTLQSSTQDPKMTHAIPSYRGTCSMTQDP